MASKIAAFRKQASQKFAIKNKSATKAEIVLYGNIGSSFWEEGISAKSVSDALKGLDSTVNELTIRINSGGGDVFDGIAIYNRLKQFKGKKIVMIDGLAASIASIIALAGDEIIMGEGALFMIHLPWTFAMGNRKEIEQTVDRLVDVEDQLVSIYVKKSGMDRNEVKKLLEAETWMSAEEAIDYGFVDKTSDEESLPIAASVFDAAWIKRAPKNYKSEASVIKQDVKDLKSKIEATLARK